jgi:1-acyl-sn-glycerol-3-phosphate acyltransferase
MAWELKAPIVPAYIGGTREAMPVGKFLPRRSKVRVMFGPPISLEAYRERSATAAREEVYRAITADVRAAIERLAQSLEAGV